MMTDQIALASSRRLVPASQPPPPPECASCGQRDDLIFPEDLELDVLCRECRSPLMTLDFPQFYCDLGGEG